MLVLPQQCATTAEDLNVGFHLAILINNGDGSFGAASLIDTEFGPSSLVSRVSSSNAMKWYARCCEADMPAWSIAAVDEDRHGVSQD